MSMQLKFNYAHILESGYCDGSMTFSYEINSPEWIPIGSNLSDYLYKFYNRENGKWYHNDEFTDEATELNG